YSDVNAGSYDAFAAIFSSNLGTTDLLHATYIGGLHPDFATGIALDSSGNVFITGYTFVTGASFFDYPTTFGAYDTSHNGLYDVFVTKFFDTLNLSDSTLIGGDDVDVSHAIVLDSADNVYITGLTFDGNVTDYPITNGTADQTHNGNIDVFVSKLSSDLSSLDASTFVGGTGDEFGNGIALDISNNVFITGHTNSTDYPATPGAYQETNAGGNDAIVSRLSSDLSSLDFSTYIGGTGDDFGNTIALDAAGKPYIAGETVSSDYPTTSGTFSETAFGSDDAFVSCLSADLSSLDASTYIGGANVDHAVAIALDDSGKAYITGHTNSTDYPTTSGAYQGSYSGGGFDDVLVSTLSSDLSNLLYSTFIGGSTGNETGHDIALGGSAYIVGLTDSTDYPTTSGAYQETYNGGGDAFVSHIDIAFITIIKTIINDDGGNAIVDDFTFRINGTAVTNGTANSVSAG
ncbi:MAG: SBBP repeat-containing protein, partial [Nitrososphaerales archaeon]